MAHLAWARQSTQAQNLNWRRHTYINERRETHREAWTLLHLQQAEATHGPAGVNNHLLVYGAALS